MNIRNVNMSQLLKLAHKGTKENKEMWLLDHLLLSYLLHSFSQYRDRYQFITRDKSENPILVCSCLVKGSCLMSVTINLQKLEFDLTKY